MRFRKVVVGVDFSATSLAAAQWAARQLAPDAEIVLVHVLREPDAPAVIRPELPPLLDVYDEVAPALQGGLRGLADLIGSSRVQVELRSGKLADELVAAARSVGADLICVGQTRTRRGSARFGATTAHRILARTATPVVVVPGVRSNATDRVLVAVGDSPAAAAFVRGSWQMAQWNEAELHVQHTLSPELRAVMRAAHAVEGDEELLAPRARLDETRAVEQTTEWLAALVAEAHAPAGRARLHVSIGDPGQEIVALSNTLPADLIVIGRADGDLTPPPAAGAELRLHVGSTARFVSWAAPCPVLVMPEVRAADPGGPRGVRWQQRRSDALPLRAGRPSGDTPLPPAASLPDDPWSDVA